MKIYRRYAIFIWLCAAMGCIDKLELPPDSNQVDAFAISGRLVKGDPSVVDIFLSDIFTFNPSRTVLADEVRLLNENGDFIELKRIETSRYRSEIESDHPFFSVDFGSSYALEVAMLDGRTFRSSYEELYPLPTITDLKFAIGTDQIINGMGELEETQFIDFIVDADLSPIDSTSLYVKFNTSRTYRLRDDKDTICYVFDNLNTLDANVIAGNTLSDPRFSEIVHSQQINYHFALDYYFGLVVESIGPGPFEYFSQVSQLVNPAEQVFQLPNGVVRTNFFNVEDTSDVVYGYFYPTALDSFYVFVDSVDVNSPSEICPLSSPVSGLDPPSICDSCPVHFSAIRPEYYVIP